FVPGLGALSWPSLTSFSGNPSWTDSPANHSPWQGHHPGLFNWYQPLSLDALLPASKTHSP
ncbi:hypothetical protein A2U01_0072354, partial [Trifolium medium]|nr:hypothetical protein [Trifolium medium]